MSAAKPRIELAFVVPIALSLLLYLPGLWADHYNDDWSQRLIAEGRAADYDANPLRLYEFTRSPEHTRQLIDSGTLPWWSSPSLHLRFFRPLSSAVFAFEHRALGGSALVSHAHSLLWFALLLVASARLFRAVLERRTALLALWLLALSPHTSTGALWVAARNGMCAATVAIFALDRYARARKSGREPPTIGVAALFVLALAFGEIALGFVPLLVALEWALTPDSNWRTRIRTNAPTLAIAATYLLLYGRFGYGAGGSGLYLDPFCELGQALRELPIRLGVLLLDATLSVPSEIYLMAPAARPALAAVGLGATGLVALALHRTRDASSREEHRALVALFVGSLFAIAPGLFGILGGRLLSIGFVGFFAAIAALWSRALSRRHDRRAAAYATIAAIVAFRVVLATMFRAGMSAQNVACSVVERRLATQHAIRCAHHADYALVDGADPALGMYAAPALALIDPSFGGTFRMLSMQPTTLLLARTGPRTIELRASEGTLTSFVFADVFRSPREPFTAGTILRHRAMQTRILTVASGRPERVEFTFDRPFETRETCLVRWRNQRLESFDPPAQGQTMRLEHERGPLGI
ncbi:MAG: hypothetical protein JNK05_20125 [Myxococcales bacterium]|nr:hypothetical protein [Myxococcales bacterium]